MKSMGASALYVQSVDVGILVPLLLPLFSLICLPDGDCGEASLRLVLMRLFTVDVPLIIWFFFRFDTEDALDMLLFTGQPRGFNVRLHLAHSLLLRNGLQCVRFVSITAICIKRFCIYFPLNIAEIYGVNVFITHTHTHTCVCTFAEKNNTKVNVV